MMNKLKNVKLKAIVILLLVITISTACTKELDNNTKTIVYGKVIDGNTEEPIANAKIYVETSDYLAYVNKTDSTLTDEKGYYELQFNGGRGGDYISDSYIKVLPPSTFSTNFPYGVDYISQLPVFGGINEMNFTLY